MICAPFGRGFPDIFGSTSLFLDEVMPKRPAKESTPSDEFPMNARTWRTVAKSLELSPQQTRIVELILQGKQDKQIAAELSLSVSTVRTYLTRIFDRTQTSDRLILVLRIFALAQGEK